MTDNSLTAADRVAVAIAETKVARHREQTLAALTNPSEAMVQAAFAAHWDSIGGSGWSSGAFSAHDRDAYIAAMTAALSAAANFLENNE